MKHITDALRQSVGVLVIVLGAAAVATGAVVMGPVIARFGPIGWLVCAILMGAWLMFCVPFLMAGFELRASGSERQRRLRDERIKEQREHFGLARRTPRPTTDDDARLPPPGAGPH